MDGIAALALMGISAGVNSLRLMANRGLVSPKEVEEYAESITSHLSVADDDPKKAAFDQLSATVEALLSPVLAEIRQCAHERWIGRGKERSEEHTSELQSLMRISYAVFCLKKKQNHSTISTPHTGRQYTVITT